MYSYAKLFVPVAVLAAAQLCAQQQYRIVNANSQQVLDIAGASTASGATADQWPWNGGSNQIWFLNPLGNGYMEITSANSGQVLDVTGASTASGAQVEQWPWNGGANQQWQIVSQGSSYNSIVNANSGQVLDVAGAQTTPGARRWYC